MNIDWNIIIIPLATILVLFVLAILFRKSLAQLINRITDFRYANAKGTEVNLKTDAKLISSLEPSQSSSDQKPIDSEQKSNEANLGKDNLPAKLYSAFLGREKEIIQVLENLSSPSGSRMIGVRGMGGVGKTALAREIADISLNRHLFETVYWATAKRTSLDPNERTEKLSKKITLDSILAGLTTWLGIDSELRGIRNRDQKEKRLRELLDATPCLIILDNLETASEDQNLIASNIRPFLNRSKAIFTSREKWDISISDLYSVNLAGLNADDSYQFMKMIAKNRNIDRVTNAEFNQLARLIETVGGIPLALKLLVGLLAVQDTESLADAITSITLDEIDEMYRYLFLGSWRKLDRVQQKLLLAISQFSEEDGASKNDLLAMEIIDQNRFNDAVNHLVKLSLVEIAGDIESTRYLLHPLTLNFVQHDILKYQ